MGNELDILNEEILELEMKKFSNVDLKTFVTYLSIAMQLKYAASCHCART